MEDNFVEAPYPTLTEFKALLARVEELENKNTLLGPTQPPRSLGIPPGHSGYLPRSPKSLDDIMYRHTR